MMEKQNRYIKIACRILISLSIMLLTIQIVDSLFYDIQLIKSKIIFANIDSLDKTEQSIPNGRSVSFTNVYELEYSFNISVKKYGHTILFGKYHNKKKITEEDYLKLKNERYITVKYNSDNPAINSIISFNDRQWKNGLYKLNIFLLVLCIGIMIYEILTERKEWIKPKFKTKKRKKIYVRYTLMCVMTIYMVYYFLNYLG